LQELHKRSTYTAPRDWVFANDAGQPRWQETILQRQLKPAALRAGIGKIGWHTFRHTYSTLLRSAGNRYQGAAGTTETRQHPDHK
jgi:integrase